jgi:hypothetical protein
MGIDQVAAPAGSTPDSAAILPIATAPADPANSTISKAEMHGFSIGTVARSAERKPAA